MTWWKKFSAANASGSNEITRNWKKASKTAKKKLIFFANKGGKMRKLAAKLRDETEEMEEEKVDVRREDKTIREFDIPFRKLSANWFPSNR